MLQKGDGKYLGPEGFLLFTTFRSNENEVTIFLSDYFQKMT